MIRRVHSKTRAGCSTCKRRRIKCDEEKPRCRNCKIHGASCVYEWMKRPTSAPTNIPSAPQVETHGTEADDLIIFSTRHMVLLHHFTTVTASTLQSNVTLKALWEVEVPKIGLSFRFLLYAILALSSLHLAHLRPDEWCVHWSRGVELYQTALAGAKREMQRVSSENRAALFLFSALTCYFSLARSRCGDTARSSTMEKDDDFFEWVFLFRGTRMLILPPDAASLESGPLAPMIEIGRQRVSQLDELLATDPVEIKALADLQAEIRGRAVEPTELVAYEGAMNLIWRSFNAVHHRSPEGVQNTDIFAWLLDVSDEFMTLLQARMPIAIALFACFSVLFRQLRGVWWVGDWTDCVLNQVYRLLEAEEEEQCLLERVQAVARAEIA